MDTTEWRTGHRKQPQALLACDPRLLCLNLFALEHFNTRNLTVRKVNPEKGECEYAQWLHSPCNRYCNSLTFECDVFWFFNISRNTACSGYNRLLAAVSTTMIVLPSISSKPDDIYK